VNRIDHDTSSSNDLLFLRRRTVRRVISSLLDRIEIRAEMDDAFAVSSACVAAMALKAFLSDTKDYIGSTSFPVDRSDDVDQRKLQIHQQHYLTLRSKFHLQALIECNGFSRMIDRLEDCSPILKQQIISSLVQCINLLQDDILKEILSPFEFPIEDNSTLAIQMPNFAKRAFVQTALLLSAKPDIALWMLEKR
jgi:hypothetical protein